MSDVSPIQFALVDVLGGAATQVGPTQLVGLDPPGGLTTQVGPFQHTHIRAYIYPPGAGDPTLLAVQSVGLSDDVLGSYGRGLWPKRYTAAERVTLRKQGVYDRRTIPLVWFWRYLTDEDEGGAAPDDTYYEEPDIYRRFDGPFGVHLAVDDSGKQKGRQRGVTLTEGEVRINITRAECVRLGAVFVKADDREATLEDEEEAGHEEGPYAATRALFIPRAGDVFMFRRQLHRIAQFEPDYDQCLSPQGTVMAWRGTASLLSMDATYPDTLKAQFVPPTSDPVVPRAGRDISWPG